MRALAVGAVLVDHGGVPGLGGGYVGVDVFFVLSGFLITSLLLREVGDAGQIDLLGFWSRRARRLLPALAVMVAAVGLAWRLFAPDAVGPLRGDSVAALAWISNWRFALQGSDYFSATQTPSPLQHTWSLGVEEQYYLLWPLIVVGLAALVGAGRRGAAASASLHRVVALVAVVGAAASAITAVVLSWTEPTGRVYFGTDTRAQALLIGSLAAALLIRFWPSPHAPSQTPPVMRGTGSALAVAGLGVLAIEVHWADGNITGFRWGLLTWTALAAVAVIIGVMIDPDGVLARGLSLRPLVALGAISYGIYLWHWPVFLVLDGARTGLSGPALFAARCTTTLALAVLSRVLVERPILRMPPTPARLLPAALVAVVIAGALVVAVVPERSLPGQVAAAGAGLDLPPPVSTLAPHAGGAAPITASASAASAALPPGSTPPSPRTGPLRVDVFGDSIGWTLAHYLPATPGVDFIDHTTLGCGIVQGGPYRYFGQEAQQPAICDSWPTRWATQVAQDRPQEVLLIVGRWETMDRLYEGHWTQLGDAAFDAYLSTELDDAITLLSATGARVILATEPYNRRGEQPDGSLYPEDNPTRVDTWNQLVRDAVATHSDSRILDLNQKLCPDGVFTWTVNGVQVRSDGVHLTPAGVDWLTPWLLANLTADQL